jgi:hypothetical protein
MAAATTSFTRTRGRATHALDAVADRLGALLGSGGNGRVPGGVDERRNRRRFRWLAVAVCLVLIPVVGMPVVSAQSKDTTVTEREVVTARLDETGRVKDVELDTFFRVEGSGRVKIIDPAMLTDITGSPRPAVDGARVGFAVDVNSSVPTDVYYRGKAKVLDGSGVVQTADGPRRIPVQVETSYLFNGSEVEDLVDIASRSGEFEMKVTVRNVTGRAQPITFTDSTSGKEVTDVGFAFVPLTVKAGPWTFDDENWKDIKVENAMLERTGKGTQVTSSQVLFPPTTPGEMSFSVKAKTKNFNLQSARISATPGIGQDQADSVQNAQELGGGATTLLYGALQQFLDGFVQLTDPEAGLPFAANGVDRVIKEGVFVLRDRLGEAGQSIQDQLIPGIDRLAGGLETLRGAIGEQLAPGLADLRDVIGTSNYFGPLCRDLPINAAGGCTFNQDQMPELPPMPALNDTFVLAANADTRGLDPDNFDSSSEFLSRAQYRTERIQRTRKGEIPDDIRSTKRTGDGFFGSIYNWAAFIKFSMQGARDADGDGVADFDEFVWPNPNTNPEYYTSAALENVALQKGEYMPGLTSTGGAAGEPFVVRLCEIVAGLNGTPGSDQDTTGDGVADNAMNACGPIPAQDITVRDLLTDKAKDRLNPLVVRLNLNTLIGVPTPAAVGATLKSTLDEVKAIFLQPPFNILFPQIPGEIDKAKAEIDKAVAGKPGFLPTVEIPLPVGEALAGSSNKGVKNALANPDSLALKGYLIENGRTSPTDPQGRPIYRPDQQFLNLGVQRSTCLTTGSGEEDDVLTLNIGEALGLDCALAHSGPLGSVEAGATVIQKLLHSEGWNFDNWLRGDPGYQVSDLGIVGTGPKIYEAINIIAFLVDRKNALCPSVIVTGEDGSGTPRIVPPRMDTPCDQVLPDSSAEDPQTVVGALANAIIPGVGKSTAPKFDASGSPTDIATAVGEIAKGLTQTVPEAIGTDNPDDVGKTIAGSLAAVRDGLAGAAVQLEPAVTGTPLLIGAVANAQITGDMTTALSKAGMERAKKYTSFGGQAKGGSKQATSQLTFVLETPGVRA